MVSPGEWAFDLISSRAVSWHDVRGLSSNFFPPVQTYSLPVQFINRVFNGELARDAVSQTKQLLAHALNNTCEVLPVLKPVFRPWGLRTWSQWQADHVYRVKTPSGATFRLAGSNYLSFELFWKGTGYYEPITTLLLQELVQPGGTFLDVGANIGFYSLVISTLKPGTKVVAFEPNPRNFLLLQNNARLNGYKNITCELLAASDHDGVAKLYLSKSDMSASLLPDFEDSAAMPIEVRTTTLDTYMDRNPPKGPVVIKVDVEGHEAAFFRGAEQTLKTIRPDIITEVALAYDEEVTDSFKRLGYHLYPITDRGLLPADEFRPVVRDRFVFLNYLISTRSPEEVAQTFKKISPAVRQIDLRKTSKYLTPEAVAKFTTRSAVAMSK